MISIVSKAIYRANAIKKILTNSFVENWNADSKSYLEKQQYWNILNNFDISEQLHCQSQDLL